jgi:hypothetical protein
MATSADNMTAFMLFSKKDFNDVDLESISSPLDTDSDSASEPFLHSEKPPRAAHTMRSPVWFVLTIALFFILLLENAYLLVQPKPRQDTYEKGFDTEFGRAFPFGLNLAY